MKNMLINFLLANGSQLAKDFFSSEGAILEEGRDAASFLSLLDTKMGNSLETVTVMTDIPDDSVCEKCKEAIPVFDISAEDGCNASPAVIFDTQSILALLQTYLNMQPAESNDCQDNAKSAAIEMFLQNVFSLLQEGESVQFLKDKPIGSFSFIRNLEEHGIGITAEADAGTVDGHGGAIEHKTFISNLASILQWMNTPEKTEEEKRQCGPNGSLVEADSEASETDSFAVIEQGGNFDKEMPVVYHASVPQWLKVSDEHDVRTENKEITQKEIEINNYTDKRTDLQEHEMFRMFGKLDKKESGAGMTGNKEIVVGPFHADAAIQLEIENENQEGLRSSGREISLLPKIEVRKLDNRDHLFQIIARASSPDEDVEMNNILSLLTVKTEKTLSSGDEDIPGIISGISEKDTGDRPGPDERQLLSQNGYAKVTVHSDREVSGVSGKAPFASIMTDRIEKITEQYANKSSSLDMVVRLRIDEKETLLVGFKEQGQRITVEIKTTNEGVGSYLQSQKEEIIRQLEGKNVYANIHVDVQNEKREKRDQRESRKKQTGDQETLDFNGFLDVVA